MTARITSPILQRELFPIILATETGFQVQENCKVGLGKETGGGGWRLSAASPQKCRPWGFAELSHQPPIFGDSPTLQIS